MKTLVGTQSSHRDTFFDGTPVRYAFSSVLLRDGFGITYKLREVMFRRYLDRLHITKKSHVLDVGCGDGILLERITQTYKCSGVGIDVSKESIKRAHTRFKDTTQTHYRLARAEKIPFADNSFDVVVSFDTLEHVGNPTDRNATQKLQENALKEMVRVLKPKGRILIYTINTNQEFTFNQLLSRLGIDIYSGFDHYHSLFLDPTSVKKTLENNNVSITTVALYNAFFTLIADEGIVLGTSLFKNIQNSTFQTFLLRICHVVSIVLLPILTIMDTPWIASGKSNSFFITGTKQ